MVFSSVSQPPIGRFAPSPTGPLHIGSLVAAVGSWLLAKSSGGKWLLRIDDLDTPRQVPGMVDDIRATLESFALLWDGEISWQSGHKEAYVQAFDELSRLGVIYPCGCSRREIAQAASAPHGDDDCIPYLGACRERMRKGSPIRSWRVRVADENICFHDLRHGRVCRNLSRQCGDFAVRRGDGDFAYQLAVVVDDHLTGVTQVARGDDLLGSTARQIYLQRLLGLPTPDYCHLPLVTGPAGMKLSKRDHLVSHHLGNYAGKEAELLLAVLRFLGQNPSHELTDSTCAEILQWGKEHFDVNLLPETGRELQIGLV